MEIRSVADSLAALGHESRLSIFRLLVEAGEDGLVASAIADRLAMPAATLSFHFAHLTRVGLIKGVRESRFIRYSADFEAMDELIAFLTRNCCHGKSCLPKTAASNTQASRRGTAKHPRP